MITGRYRQQNMVIHQGDARDVLLSMNTTVHCVVTSPPYNLGIKYGRYDDHQLRDKYLDWSRQWAAQVRVGEAPRVELYVELSRVEYLRIVDYGLADGLPKPVAPSTRAGHR